MPSPAPRARLPPRRLRRRRPRADRALLARGSLPVRDGAARVSMRASHERVDARRVHRRDPPARDAGRAEVEIDLVILGRGRERAIGRRAHERVQQRGVRRRARARCGRRKRAAVGGRAPRPPKPRPREPLRGERVDALPQEPPPAEAAVVRGQVSKREVIVVVHVDDDDGLDAHLLAHDVHGYGVEVAAVHEKVAVFRDHGRE
eukprot:31112-Pelagococcus_subviridis.AAC.1